MCVLWLTLALHFSWCREREGYYTDKVTVCVPVDGDSQMVTSIADSFGMKNLGPVSALYASVFVLGRVTS